MEHQPHHDQMFEQIKQRLARLENQGFKPAVEYLPPQQISKEISNPFSEYVDVRLYEIQQKIDIQGGVGQLSVGDLYLYRQECQNLLAENQAMEDFAHYPSLIQTFNEIKIRLRQFETPFALSFSDTPMSQFCRVKQIVSQTFDGWETISVFDPRGEEDTRKISERKMQALLQQVGKISPILNLSSENIGILQKSINDLVLNIASENITNHQTRYHVCARTVFVIANIINTFIVNLQEIEQRSTKNMEAINQAFGFQATSIASISIQNSDPHNGGKRVAFVTFDDKSVVVYKPRDIRADAQIVGQHEMSVSTIVNQGMQQPDFQAQLATTVQQHCAESSSLHQDLKQQLNLAFQSQNTARVQDLPTYRFLDCKEHDQRYGFVQFLSHEEKDYILGTNLEARAYYRQMGRLAAIARMFGITDLHQENLMACHKQPYLIDLEFTYDFRTLSGLANTDFTLISGACTLFGLSAQNVVELAGFTDDRHALHKQFLGDIMLGYLEATTALQLSSEALTKFFPKIPNILRTRCFLEGTATFANWPVIFVTKNEITTFVNALMGSLSQPYAPQLGATQQFSKGLTKDLLNSDTPIFYQQMIDHAVVYHDEVIYSCPGTQTTQQLIQLNIQNADMCFLKYCANDLVSLIPKSIAEQSAFQDKKQQ